MRDDLLPAQAAIDWAIAQINVFTRRVGGWNKSRPYIGVPEPDGDTGNDILKAKLVGEPLPLIVNAEAGAIINMLRSSLDILTVSLAERNGHIRAKDVNFPIAKSEAAFSRGNNPAVKKIARLSEADQARIKNLKPYKGGDDILFSLHKLDIIRKHQRLVDVTTIPGRGAMLYRSGGGHADAEQLFRGDLKDGAPLWRIARNPEAEVYLPLQISFTEAALADRRPVREVLRTFAERATQVIALFD